MKKLQNRKLPSRFLFGLAVCLLSVTSVQAAEFGKLNVNGYFSFEYERNIEGDEEGDLSGSFDLDLIDIVFNYQAHERVRIAGDITWEHGTASEDDRGNAAVEYAFAEYTHADWLQLRAGKMFTYFSIYNEIHTAKPAYLTVKEPLATNKNNKLGSQLRFYPRWNTGLAAFGHTYVGDLDLNYVIQISNGESEEVNAFEEDSNVHKAINGRATLGIMDGMELGFSFYKDEMEEAEAYDDSITRAEVNSYSLHYNWFAPSNTQLELEYVTGDEQFDGFDAIDRYGYSIMIAQYLDNNLTPYIRYEYLDPDDNTGDDEAELLIAGINYRYSKNIHLKLELDRVSTGDNNSKFDGADFTEAKASISIGF